MGGLYTQVINYIDYEKRAYKHGVVCVVCCVVYVVALLL